MGCGASVDDVANPGETPFQGQSYTVSRAVQLQSRLCMVKGVRETPVLIVGRVHPHPSLPVLASPFSDDGAERMQESRDRVAMRSEADPLGEP